jgi:gas vesicle protein
MKSSSKIGLFSFIAGAAIGAIAGILLAPDKGSVTREKLKKQAKDLGENLNEKYGSMKDELKNIREKMKTNSKEKVESTPE